MGDKVNLTSITIDGYVEVEKYRYVYFVVMFTVYVLIICSNSTIVYLIVTQQSLHEPMYVFIAALLINSVLYSTAVYPKLLIDFLSDKQTISYQACLFQYFMFYALAASEFLLLAAMAFDRYVSICKPLQYAAIMRRKTVTTFLVLVWFVPALEVSVPTVLNANKKLCNFTFKGIICNSTFYRLHCVASKELRTYGLVILVTAVLLPVFFIFFTYARILITSYRSCREVRRKAAQTCLPHLIVLINFTCLSAYDVLLLRVNSEIPKLARFIMTLQIVMYHPLFNPIIYGLKMKEIHKLLKKLLCKLVLCIKR